MTLQEELAFGKRYERVAAELYVQERWPGAQLVESPAFADLDWQVVAPRPGSPPMLLAWLEVKTRRIDSNRYQETLVAWRKYEAASFGKAYFKVPTIALVLFTDTAATFSLHEEPDGKQKVRRYDRPGIAPDHAFYNRSRFTWHPELLERVLARLEAGV